LQPVNATVIIPRMKKALVTIPTYDERETLQQVIDSILKHEGFDVLVVDDGSPDGTASLVNELMLGNSRIHLIERAGKLGLGTAYVEGFTWGLDRDYDYFIEMDADGSHDPDVLPSFVEKTETGFDFILGSRYLNGTISVVGWDFRRLALSKFGNYYASRILGLRLTDLTSGFRCYSKQAVKSIDLEKIHSNGYAFQIELAYRVSITGCRFCEIPIIFYERVSGYSKMSKKIISEAAVLPWRLRIGSLTGPVSWSAGPDFKYHIRTIAGVVLLAAGLVSGIRLGWWLGSEGDIIEIIHRAKMGLPGWAWIAMKAGLSALSAILFIVLSLGVAIAVFAGGRRK
jgi:dolichol-phosphate mannosyltransferase